MVTVSLIQDDPGYRKFLKRAMRSNKQFRLISSYATAEEAVKRLQEDNPAVALVEIRLPTIDGIECVRRLRALRPRLATQFVMWTECKSDDMVFGAFRAGAHGYLLKSQTPIKELFRALKEVIKGGAPMTPIIARAVITIFQGHERPVILLTDQEQKVLFFLSKGLAYKQIASELSISIDTVRLHLRSIYKKLGVHSRTDAAMRYGHDQQWSQTTSPPKDVVRRNPNL